MGNTSEEEDKDVLGDKVQAIISFNYVTICLTTLYSFYKNSE
jgi:hypothetical protein